MQRSLLVYRGSKVELELDLENVNGLSGKGLSFLVSEGSPQVQIG